MARSSDIALVDPEGYRDYGGGKAKALIEQLARQRISRAGQARSSGGGGAVHRGRLASG